MRQFAKSIAKYTGICWVDKWFCLSLSRQIYAYRIGHGFMLRVYRLGIYARGRKFGMKLLPRGEGR